MENVLRQDLIKDLNANKLNTDVAKFEDGINEGKRNYVNQGLSLDDIFNSNIDSDDLTFSLAREAKVPEGEYSFVLRGVHRENNQTTKYGLKNQIVWSYEITDSEGNKFSIIDKNNISDSYKSKFRKNLKSYCEALKLTKINLNDLIGIKGTLKVQHNTDDDGNTYENIAEIYPINEFEKITDDNVDEFNL